MASPDKCQPSSADLPKPVPLSRQQVGLDDAGPNQQHLVTEADIPAYGPLCSREPVEDDYPGMVIVDRHPDAYPGASYVDQFQPRTVSSSSTGAFSQENDGKAACLRSGGDQPGGFTAPQGHDLIHRVDSIEARMEVQDRIQDMTLRQLLDLKQELAKIPQKYRTKELRQKTDKYIEEIEGKNKELEKENVRLQDLVVAAREQAEKERRYLEYKKADKKLEDKLEELKQQLKITSEDRDRAVKEKVDAESDKECFLRERDDWRNRSTESNKERETVVTDLEEKSKRLEITEKNLAKIKQRCDEVTQKNVQLRRENSYLKETIFRVVRVGTATAAFDTLANSNRDVELECYSCHSAYMPAADRNDNQSCRFHPLPAMHFKEWSRWPVGKEPNVNREKLYWPCCDKLFDSRPEGCSVGRHHQSWEMDIMMKQILLSKNNLDWE